MVRDAAKGDQAMKLTAEDTELLRSWGYHDGDFAQIEEAMQKSKTKYSHYCKLISREEAIRLLGRRKYLAGLCRSAFHRTAVQDVGDGTFVHFDSGRLFGKE